MLLHGCLSFVFDDPQYLPYLKAETDNGDLVFLKAANCNSLLGLSVTSTHSLANIDCICRVVVTPTKIAEI